VRGHSEVFTDAQQGSPGLVQAGRLCDILSTKRRPATRKSQSLDDPVDRGPADLELLDEVRNGHAGPRGVREVLQSIRGQAGLGLLGSPGRRNGLVRPRSQQLTQLDGLGIHFGVAAHQLHLSGLETATTCLARHRQLRCFWMDHQTLFAVLPQDQQRQVHAYFVPTKDLPDAELILHRRAMIKQRPSLSARAGKAFTRMEDVYRESKTRSQGDTDALAAVIWAPATKVSKSTDNGHHIEIAAIAQPELDIQLIVSALIEHAIEKAQEPRNQRDAA